MRHNGIEMTRRNREEQTGQHRPETSIPYQTKQEREFRKMRAGMMGRIVRLEARNYTLKKKLKAARQLLTEEQRQQVDLIPNPLTIDDKFRHKKPPVSEYRRIVNDLIAVGIIRQDGRKLVIV